MKFIPLGVALLAIGVVGGPSSVPVRATAAVPDAARKWEYRVLTKEQVLDLGKKDLATGLNQLGNEGWELVAIDGAYIFKRPGGQVARRAEDIKSAIAFIETDIEYLKDRTAWAERMFKKGYMSERQVEAQRAALKRAEMALERAKRDLQSLPAENERKPEK